jgi:hypothetical protein
MAQTRKLPGGGWLTARDAISACARRADPGARIDPSRDSTAVNSLDEERAVHREMSCDLLRRRLLKEHDADSRFAGGRRNRSSIAAELAVDFKAIRQTLMALVRMQLDARVSTDAPDLSPQRKS